MQLQWLLWRGFLENVRNPDMFTVRTIQKFVSILARLTVIIRIAFEAKIGQLFLKGAVKQPSTLNCNRTATLIQPISEISP